MKSALRAVTATAILAGGSSVMAIQNATVASGASETALPDASSIDAYLGSRGLAQNRWVIALLSMTDDERRSALISHKIDPPTGPITEQVADRVLGLWLAANGDSTGASLVLRSPAASPAEQRSALTALTLRDVVVSPAAVKDVSSTHPKASDAERESGAYLQRLAEIVGQPLSNILPGFNSLRLSWEDGQEPALQLWVTKDSLAPAQEVLNQSELLSEIELQQASISSRDLETRITETASILRADPELSKLVSNLSTGGTLGHVVLHPDRSQAISSEELRRAVNMRPELSEALSAGELSVGEPRDPVTPETNVAAYGGTNASVCTWGFNANRNVTGNTEVMMTAGHCYGGSSLTYAGLTSPYVSNYNGIYGDVGIWLLPSSGGTTYVGSNIIYAASGDYRNINAKVNYSAIAINATVCHQGITTGYSCGTVTDKTGGPNYDNLFIEINNAQHSGGDSGGPWFLGTSAYGIHHGGGGTYSYFTATDYAEYFANSTLRTK